MANKLCEYPRVAVTFDAAATVATYTLLSKTAIVAIPTAGVHFSMGYGLCNLIVLEIPNYTDAAPATTLTIENPQGDTLFTSAALAENATHEIHEDANGDRLDCPIGPGYVIKLTAATAPDAAAAETCYVTIFYVR